MKVAAIIAEYNPFHKGHQYLVRKAKEMTGADYIITIMSGNFTQRGTPAIADKYLRARMALQNDVDLVLELPVHYACSSAEYFAKGAVSILNQLGVVDYLCFGSESGDLEKLTSIAKILASEPEEYQKNLRTFLKRGMSYPLARNQALEMIIPDFVEYEDMIKTPNNILAIEYLKALLRENSSIRPRCFRRVGNGYYDYKLNVAYSSAISIRHALKLGTSIMRIMDQVPASCHPLMLEQVNKSYPIFPGDFDTILKYRLLTEAPNGYTKYADVSSDLSDKIRKNLFKMDNMEDFCDLLKTKDLTHARISRCLGHILLDITQDEIDELKSCKTACYVRVLGFRQSAEDLLSQIKANTSIPLITKPADAGKLLSEEGRRQFEKDIEVSHIYEMIVSSKYGHAIKHEYKRQIIKV